MATIKSKIIINVIITLLTTITIVGLEYYNLSNLGKMQDEGAQRSQDAVNAKEASMDGLALYRIIADAVINRKLDQTATDWAAKKAEVLKNIELTVKAADTPEEKKLANEVQAATQEVINLFEGKLLPLLKTTDGITTEIRDLDKKLDEQVGKIEVGMDKVVASMQNEMKSADEKFDATRKAALLEAMIIGVIGILLQAGLGAWLIRTIMQSVDTMRLLLTAVFNGDLTAQIKVTAKDELTEICNELNLFTEKLCSMIKQIADTSAQVATASNQLTATSERIATGAEEVAAQSATVATAGEEMSATSGDIAQNCQLAAEGAQRASQSANNGAGVVERTVAVMGQIAVKVQESAKTVESLGERSDQIGAIIGTIEDIADQTNLLALNAAIEAARAGEQGRGFAVVADEVRALAERTTRATQEIGEMIKAIQKETKGAVAAMEQGVEQVEAGTAETAKSGDALRDILEQVHDVAMQVNQIATAAEQQTATTSEISSNMHQITQVVQNTASGAHQSATAASQLHGNAEELQRLVRQFKVS